jgi:hypothetical protein
MAKYKHSFGNQAVTFKDALIPQDDPHPHKGAFAVISYILIGVVIGAFYVVTVKSFDKPTYQRPCESCHAPNLTTYKLYRDYIRQNRSEYLESQVILAELR